MCFSLCLPLRYLHTGRLALPGQRLPQPAAELRRCTRPQEQTQGDAAVHPVHGGHEAAARKVSDTARSDTHTHPNIHMPNWLCVTRRQQEAILDDLAADIPREFDFLFSRSHAEVIPGKQEGELTPDWLCQTLLNSTLTVCVSQSGVYAWIGINFVLGRFDHPDDGKCRTDGVLSQTMRT